MFVPLNLLVWTYVVGSLGTLYQLATAALYFLAYDGANTKAKSTDSTTAATAVTLKASLIEDMQYAALLQIWFGFMYVS
eukprot:CAMPEP_0185583144 /NCGR_PEP_ID=MMETSP0434-20130131/21347_1 /TAXON_ID=626734 ORGANISM="Favella taraikaensis, Strain Fe Narragansett Bay" /NCGR_SAMPLE_ID=MMETSP0434 /ASSEMBLY_ACC=CAM_ASM_000379 /LENGTH=78 /DNA_ID=CAMNT_0028202153 /DNA_START=399 /DNA_END=635 /DNA_ORIENTATION=+